MTRKVTKKSVPKLHHKHFFTAGVAAFFATGAILGLFFWSQLNARNNFSSAIHTFKPGQSIANDFYEVRIDSVARTNGEQGSMKPGSGKEYLVVDLYVKNKSSKTLPFFPVTQTYVKDDGGQTYPVGPAMVKQPFQAGDIVSGDKIKGQIAYEVPTTIKNPRFYLEGLASVPVVVQLQ